MEAAVIIIVVIIVVVVFAFDLGVQDKNVRRRASCIEVEGYKLPTCRFIHSPLKSNPPCFLLSRGYHPTPYMMEGLPDCQQPASPHSRLLVGLNLPVAYR